MKNISGNLSYNRDASIRERDILDYGVGKMKFQNEEFGRHANHKLSSYLTELDGVVGIEDDADTLRVEYDTNVLSVNEVKRAADHFKGLFQE